jgi:uncharacterized protein
VKASALLVALACLLSAPFAARADAPDPFRVPELTGPVVDEANWLSPSDRERIAERVRAFLAQGKAQMAVYIPATLQGYDIETASIRVAEKWGLGGKKDDRGVLLVVAPKERQMRIEVGYGLEGELTDARSRRILDDILKPHLRDSRPGDGILATVDAIGRVLESPGVDVKLPGEDVPFGTVVLLLVIGLVVGGSIFAFLFGGVAGGGIWLLTRNLLLASFAFMFVSSIFRRRSRGLFSSGWGRHSGGGWGSFGGWGGGGGFGGGGGGGWSGGGGGFGGGGSSSSW